MMYYPVKSARHVEGYVVEFTFTDGSRRQIDLEPFLHRGIFKELHPIEAFLRLKVDKVAGTIVWPNGADIAPETLYHDLGPVSREETTEAKAPPSDKTLPGR